MKILIIRNLKTKVKWHLMMVSLKKYLGDYTSSDIPLDLKVFVNDDKLFGQGKGQPEFSLGLVEKDQFRFEQAGITLTFFPETNKMQLLQNGKTYNFTKK